MILLNVYSENNVDNYLLNKDEYQFVMYEQDSTIYGKLAKNTLKFKDSTILTMMETRSGRLKLLSKLFKLKEIKGQVIDHVVNVKSSDFVKNAVLSENVK